MRTIGARGDTGHAMENIREVAGRSKAEAAPDCGDRSIVSHQQSLRLLDPLVQDETVRRQAGAELEQPREVKHAHARDAAELGEPRVAMDVGVDVLHHAPQGRSRETG